MLIVVIGYMQLIKRNLREIDMELKRYLLKRNEAELKEIEKDLAEYLDVPLVKCSYDCVNSHKYQNKEEMKYRKENVEDADDTTMLDYIINYEIYSTGTLGIQEKNFRTFH